MMYFRTNMESRKHQWFQLVVVTVVLAGTCVAGAADSSAKGNDIMQPALENDPANVARLLAEADVWIIPQPKEATVTAGTLPLAECKDIRIGGAISPKGAETLADFPALLEERSGVALTMTIGKPEKGSIAFGVFPDGVPSEGFTGITAADLEGLGCEGYVLVINADGVTAAAREMEGLYYAGRTLAQIATDRTELPCVKLRDWPSLRYRGVQQDICRGQVPTMDTFKRLADILSEGKGNVLELYIEHTFKWKKYPDISPPEGISPEEGRELFDYGARRGIEVHPLFQVLGHSYHILHLPQYQHLRIGPCKKQPWIMTFDVRKPEAIAMVDDLIGELCEAFPGTYLNVDITEIDCDGMLESGMTVEDVTDMVYQYVLKLRDMLRGRDMRLMIAQGPLDSTGHLAGMGPKLDLLPKDVMIGSYYCAGGGYSPAYEKDYPRMRDRGIDFFSQAWIGSHIRIMPSAKHAGDFSDGEVARGVEYGALGSITCDWGDAGNFHLTGQTWLPFMYHCSSAWTGATQDRDYFDRAACRLLYGAASDDIARAFRLASDISTQKVKLREEDGKIVERGSYHFYEFLNNPFVDKRITALADPGAKGAEILKPADEAVRLLEQALPEAARNRDNVEQLLFGARCYQAMGRKLVALGHYLDGDYPRDKVIDEFEEIVRIYTGLQSDFERLWLAEDRENDNFHGLVARFGHTIGPVENKIKELKEGLTAPGDS